MQEFIEIPANNKSYSKRTLVFGKGINDADYLIENIINSKRYVCPYYRVWHSMIKRCYSSKVHIKQPTYINCSVCDEWLKFSNFKLWMKQQDWQNNVLDKDLLVYGNTQYSPETSIFITQELNNLFNTHKSTRGKYKIGVCWHKTAKKFLASCSYKGKQKSLGLYNSENEAYITYYLFKKDIILEIANKQTNIQLKNALIKRANLLQIDN